MHACTATRVRAVLQQMREAAAPGMLDISIAVWQCLPEEWMVAVARLLTMMEGSGTWPSEWLDAYIAMIPKASGGARPRDQRPITVLEVMYRVWSKGVSVEWKPVLQKAFLSQAAMGSGRKRGRCTWRSCWPTSSSCRSGAGRSFSWPPSTWRSASTACRGGQCSA